MPAETPRIKICGLTRAEDAFLAARLGAWALGFIFYPPSPRYVSPDAAARIIRQLPPGLKTVGVFVNAPLKEIAETANITGIQAVQFHGHESPADVTDIKLETIKAFRLKSEADLGQLSFYKPTLGYLLDSPVPGVWGGSGVKSDWKLARDARRLGNIILSGGLTPENVVAALKEVEPWAVDVSSGVEDRPGIKSAEKLQRFFQQAGAAYSTEKESKP